MVSSRQEDDDHDFDDTLAEAPLLSTSVADGAAAPGNGRVTGDRGRRGNSFDSELEFIDNTDNAHHGNDIGIGENEHHHHVNAESWNSPRSNITKVVAVFYGMIIFGMNDSSLGVLVQSLESHYHISYRTVSYSFLCAFSGYLVAAFICDHLHRYLGRWGVSSLGVGCQLLCYIIAASAPPFPLFVIAYCVSGFGNGLLEAAWNTWAGNLRNQNEIMGLLHGFYGLGGMICPTVATAMISHGYKWNQVYLFLIAVTSISLVLTVVAFRKDTPHAYRLSISIEKEGDDNTLIMDSEEEDDDDDDDYERQQQHVPEKAMLSTGSSIKDTFKSPLVWLVSFSLFCYVGAEVTMGGWVTSFMIDVRHGNEHRMGYVATGFWTGLTVGRMILGFVAGKRFAGKESLLVAGYLCAALVFQLFFWVIPQLVISAICAALIGVFIGPLYPSIMIVFFGKFPKHLHVIGVGVVASAGGIGGALLPFICGSLATTHSVAILGPYVLVAFALMLLTWIVVMKLC